MFMGEHRHSIDDKNRLVIPSSYRDSLGSSFIITRGLEKCLYIYTESEWQKIVDKLASLPFTKKDARTFIRSFFSAAANCTLDKQGRINITPNQALYAGLNKECVIIGANDRVEIWSKENWEEFNLEFSDALESVAEHLFNGED
ncbi:MAG: division/cell wall cluster transcriptional repressor MraZ [Bacilli bacterium]|jgi:MraZ protein|nr:division/cell wall cluster transcriptional repressor MraZ [Bacilli bacterium]MCX4254733.1 division/cell wall cluster transcriptional repressor MraZ [Bacilli bacterium]